MPVLETGFLLPRHYIDGLQSDHARIVTILPVQS